MAAIPPPVEETWSLGDLFPDDAAFEQARSDFAQSLPGRADAFRGRLLSSAETLAQALDEICEARERLQKLQCYASLRSDGDVRVGKYQSMRQEVQLLATDLAQRLAFLQPEILAAPPETIEGFLREEPRLARHAHGLRDLMRQREHVLGPAEESIIAQSGLLRSEPSTLYQILTNAELPRPEVLLSNGTTVKLSVVAFHRHRASLERVDRLSVFPAYFSTYASFRGTLGQNLYAAVKSHMFRARVRGYPSCLAAALDGDRVPEKVYRNLIAEIRSRRDLLHRYFRLRAGALGLERIEYPDLYCPLGSAPPLRYTPPEARALVARGLTSLGREYAIALEQAFDSRWIDWHPAEGKRSGAYATGSAYATHPYVLLNFNADYESVSTLAHEMGHAMHSHFSNRRQPFATANYSIFVAEVASTLNEALLLGHRLDEAASIDERSFLLATHLDGIRGTLFRQTMFAEFELEIHERAESGEVLTGERLDEIYLRLLREYHGHDEGVVHIDDRYAVEWAAIPHMYYDFYVYQYATGIVAATALARAVASGEEDAQRRYLDFLASGGSDYPLDLLRRAGVDLEQTAPYRDALEAVATRLDQLEELIPGGRVPGTR